MSCFWCLLLASLLQSLLGVLRCKLVTTAMLAGAGRRRACAVLEITARSRNTRHQSGRGTSG
eukprot:14149063-Alexandrium_andersonii.AAC.1